MKYRSKPTLCKVAITTAFAFLLTAFSPALADANWPQWRGPHANGLAEGKPPIEWSETKNVQWKAQIPGQGHGTPVVWGDKIFLLAAVPTGVKAATVPPPPNKVFGQQRRPDQQERRRRFGQGGSGRGRGGFGRGAKPTEEMAFTTLCLNRTDGKIIWERIGRAEVPHQGVQSSNKYSAASAVTDGDRVYASFGSSGLYCYDMDGNLLWNKDFGKVSVTFGEASSPAVHGNTLVIVRDNNDRSQVVALNATTGDELWSRDRDERSGWTTPSFLERHGTTEVLLTGANAVRGYDLSNGEVLWQCSGLGSNPVPMLLHNDGSIIASSGHRNGAVMAFKLGAKGDLTDTDAVQWTITRGTPYVPSPLLYHNTLLFCQRNDAILTCVDPASGDIHYQQERVEGVGGIYASPVGVNGHIYWPTQTGVTMVLKAGKDLTVVAKNKLNDAFDASPVVIGNQLFLRGHESLYCLAEQ